MAKMADTKKSLTVTLPVAQANFVHLFVPTAPAAGADAAGKEKVYSLELTWPKAQTKRLMVKVTDYDKEGKKSYRTMTLDAALLEVAESAWPGKGADVLRKQKYPVLRDGDDKEQRGYAGKDYLHAAKKARYGHPRVFDSKLREVVTLEERDRRQESGIDTALAPGEPDEEVYSGCDVETQVQLYPWDHELGGKMVNVSLLVVRVRHKGERIGGVRADEDAFDEEPDEGDEPSEDEGHATGTRGGAHHREPWE